MNFQGNGLPLSAQGLNACCADLGASPAQLWAVLLVETGGFGFLGDRRPQMLFERHVFRRLTRGSFDREHPDLSHAEPGGYLGGRAEYARLARAQALDFDAALRSASWGLGQILGENHLVVGYADPVSMIQAMAQAEDAQVKALAAFVRESRLAQALRQNDWARFARRYNGPQYQSHAYDRRLAAAHARCREAMPDLDLRAAQAALIYLGYAPGPVDGYPGPRTRAALARFQADAGLKGAGELDRATAASLHARAFAAPATRRGQIGEN